LTQKLGWVNYAKPYGTSGIVIETALHILCDWGLGHLKIQAPGLSFYKTRWLSRHPCQQDTTLCSCCATAEWLR